MSYYLLGLITGALLCVLVLVFAYAVKKKSKIFEQSKPPESLAELQENYTLLLKTARRCARDLSHATDLIDREKMGGEVKDMFYSRYKHYETVFGGTNDYRLDLHRQIEVLRNELEDWKSASN